MARWVPSHVWHVVRRPAQKLGRVWGWWRCHAWHNVWPAVRQASTTRGTRNARGFLCPRVVHGQRQAGPG